MKINFDWHNIMSKNTEKTSQGSDDYLETKERVQGTKSVYRQTLMDISEKALGDFKYGEQGTFAQKINEVMGSEEY